MADQTAVHGTTGMPGASRSSLMTSLGLVEGDLLTYLERHGATTLRRLIRESDWPAPMIMMGLGALIRQGLARALQHDLEVIVEPQPDRVPPSEQPVEPPGVWGG